MTIGSEVICWNIIIDLDFIYMTSEQKNGAFDNYRIIEWVKLCNYLNQTSLLIKSINIIFKQLSKVTGGS